MSVAANFCKKLWAKPELAQLVFRVAVLNKYVAAGLKVQRTETVGRVKSATWSVDFGIAPDEATIHTSLAVLSTRLPESEREHWLSHLHETRFSSNFLRMMGGQSCVDDGGLRAWGEEESLF